MTYGFSEFMRMMHVCGVLCLGCGEDNGIPCVCFFFHWNDDKVLFFLLAGKYLKILMLSTSGGS